MKAAAAPTQRAPRPFSRELTRIALIVVAAAVLAMALASWLGTMALENYSMSRLSPDVRAELFSESNAPLSPKALAELEAVNNPQMYNWLMGAMVVLGLVTGASVGYLHARRLIAPLGDLAEAARRLREGELTTRAPVGISGVAEFENFIADFNAMAEAGEKAEREQRASSAAIAHELRTPLTVLQGRISGMVDGVFPLNTKSLEPLLVQTELLARIVEDLRLLTLARAGQLHMHTTATDARREAEAVATSMQDLLCADGGQLELDLHSAPLQADPMRLRQALQALLINAKRYGASPYRMEAGMQQTANHQPQVYLRVLDRGPGLDVEQAQHAFDRFWRAEDSRGRESGGSGLGLSVVQAIAHAHGGQVRYLPRPGGGAVFEMLLPAARA